MVWDHVYDPLGSPLLSTLVAMLPVVVLLGLLAGCGWSAQRAAAAGLLTALAVAVGVVGMPVEAAVAAAAYGACFGLFPIGWIIVTAMFLYSLSVEAGALDVMKRSVTRLSADHRIQALLIAFSFGAFLEGAAGFGAPVAISAALLTGSGFPPFEAACLALIANTAPVAFGALGTPIITLAKVTGLEEQAISAMAGRQLPFFSLIIPAWMVVTMAGWKGLVGVWPAVLVCGRHSRFPRHSWQTSSGRRWSTSSVGSRVSPAWRRSCASGSRGSAGDSPRRPRITDPLRGQGTIPRRGSAGRGCHGCSSRSPFSPGVSRR